jgi:hypothetical protein
VVQGKYWIPLCASIYPLRWLATENPFVVKGKCRIPLLCIYLSAPWRAGMAQRAVQVEARDAELAKQALANQELAAALTAAREEADAMLAAAANERQRLQERIDGLKTGLAHAESEAKRLRCTAARSLCAL